MSCTSTCKAPTPAQAHCSACHHTFSGVYGFDRHRKAGSCLDPQALDMVEVNRVWRGLPRGDRPAHWGSSTED